jgi:hypothetical protein
MRRDLQMMEEIADIGILDDAVQQLRRVALLCGYGHLVIHFIHEDQILRNLKSLSTLRKVCVYVSDLKVTNGDSWFIENGVKVHTATWDDFDEVYNEVKDSMEEHEEKSCDVLRVLGLLGGVELERDKGFIRYAFKIQSNLADFIYVLMALGRVSNFTTSYIKDDNLYLVDCYTEF